MTGRTSSTKQTGLYRQTTNEMYTDEQHEVLLMSPGGINSINPKQLKKFAEKSEHLVRLPYCVHVKPDTCDYS